MGFNNISAQRKQIYEAISKFLGEEVESLKALQNSSNRSEKMFYEHLVEAKDAISSLKSYLVNLNNELYMKKVKLG